MSPEEVLETPVAVDFTVDVTEVGQENSPLVDQLSEPIIGKWNRLVSQTNWEKGTLILDWRNELIAAGLPNTAYSDEAWARRVGNLSSQHVGKLRRVAERFAETQQNYPGLYWSHFNVALDWNDAELWLEGALQNGWSVAQMRVQRWDALGASDDQKPQEDNILTADFDDDSYAPQPLPDRIEGRTAVIGAADTLEGGDSAVSPTNSAAEPSKKKEQTKKDKAKNNALSHGSPVASPALGIPKMGELLTSLKGISEFPADMADAMELLKVAVLNHKLAGWKAVSAEQVSQALETLKMLTIAED